MSKQLALFGGEPPKKDPRKQQVADQVGMMGFTADMDFAQQVRHVTLDGRTYYSVLDVLKHYGSEGSAKDAPKYWERIKSQLDEQGEVMTDVSYLRQHKFPGERHWYGNKEKK